MREDASTEEKYELNGESFAEACALGGLLKYWYGESDAKRRNLATCKQLLSCGFASIVDIREELTLITGIWQNCEDALRGRNGPWHSRAIVAAPRLYEDFHVSLSHGYC